jgi:hypothetical protein
MCKRIKIDLSFLTCKKGNQIYAKIKSFRKTTRTT